MTLRDLNPKWKPRKGEGNSIVTEVEFDMSEYGRFWPGLTHVVVHHWLQGTIWHLNLYVPDNAVWVVMEKPA